MSYLYIANCIKNPKEKSALLFLPHNKHSLISVVRTQTNKFIHLPIKVPPYPTRATYHLDNSRACLFTKHRFTTYWAIRDIIIAVHLATQSTFYGLHQGHTSQSAYLFCISREPCMSHNEANEHYQICYAEQAVRHSPNIYQPTFFSSSQTTNVPFRLSMSITSCLKSYFQSVWQAIQSHQ